MILYNKIINNKFLSLIFLISFLIFVYTLIRSEIVFEGRQRSYYTPFYLTSFLILIFGFLFNFLNNTFKIYLQIIFFSIVATLYIFEGYITILYWDFDHRTRLTVYQEIKKKHREAVVPVKPSLYLHEVRDHYHHRSKTNFYKKNPDKVGMDMVGSSMYDIFPLSGASNSMTLHCNENGYYSTYLSDRYGFNNPDEEWDKKKISYFLIGDSFLHGECVNRPNDISSLLRNMSGKSVLNLGYYGNSALIQYAGLREYLHHNVKNIIYFYDERSDLTELRDEFDNDVLNNYFEDTSFTQNLKSKQILIDNITRIEIKKRRPERIILADRKANEFKSRKMKSSYKIIKFLKLYDSRKMFLSTKKKITYKESFEELNYGKFSQLLKKIKIFSEKNNANFIVVYLPSYYRYTQKNHHIEKTYEQIKSILADEKIQLIDIHTEVFEKRFDKLGLFPFRGPGHYNEKGYYEVTKAIYKNLSKLRN